MYIVLWRIDELYHALELLVRNAVLFQTRDEFGGTEVFEVENAREGISISMKWKISVYT